MNAKRFERELRASMATDSAARFVDKNNAEWGDFGRNVATARMQGFISTNRPQYECWTPRRNEVRLDDEDTNTVMPWFVARVRANDNTAPNWRCVTRERHLEFGRITGMTQYKLALTKLEFTTDVVLTKAQIETLANMNGWGKIYCSLRRRDTGATALYIRQDNVHMVLFEDGSFTKSYNVPEFVGSWAFNKRVRRDFRPAVTNTVKANVEAKSFTINRGYK